MANYKKAVTGLQKLYAKRDALNKQIVKAEKVLIDEVKAIGKSVAKLTKAKKTTAKKKTTGRKPRTLKMAFKKPGAKKTTAKKITARKPAGRKVGASRKSLKIPVRTPVKKIKEI